jgi:RNA polymerase sigma-70 factor, ECF subfamily
MPVEDADRSQQFEALVLPHLAAAYNLARWMCRSATDASDIVQEAMMRALQYFAGYRGGDARAWLLQIVRYAAHSWLARNRPVGQLPLPEECTEPAAAFDGRWLATSPAAGDPLLGLAAREEAEGLREAIARLPLEQREVLILREFEELSYREIASIIDAPLGTVMSRLARARDQLAALVRAGAETSDAAR